jgi:ribosomal protein L29
MADKKTTKKAEEVKTIADLRKDLEAKQTDLLEARRGHAAGELANPRVITATRKEIARLQTAIRAAELSEKESK